MGNRKDIWPILNIVPLIPDVLFLNWLRRRTVIGDQLTLFFFVKMVSNE